MGEDQVQPGLKWSVERRLEFIEFRLLWEGRLNRSDLMEQFGISTPQASADIARYQRLAPRNAEYDRTAKTYVAAPTFSPVFGAPDSQGYLNGLRSVAYKITTLTESWVGEFPSFDTVPYPKREVDPETLRSVLRAIHGKQALEVSYQSLSRPEPIWRWITPHALGYDGLRWHARGLCHIRRDFRDFVLGRILSIRNAKADNVDSQQDRAWHEFVTLIIGTHPDLPAAQRRSVELDYGMQDGRLEIAVRAALYYYMERWLRLDLDVGAIKPEQQQIILMNRDELEERVAEHQSASIVK